MKLPVSKPFAAPALRSLIPSFALAAALVGCGDKLDQNPLFRDQQNIVARLEDESKSVGRQVEDVNLTVAQIKQDVREMKNTPGGGQVSADLAARLQEIQDALRDNTTRLAQLEIRMNKEGRAAAATTVSAKAAEKTEKAVARADAKATESGKGAAGTKVVKTSSASSSSSSEAKSKGKYYVVQDGDSAEQIAKKHHVTVTLLMTANGIPGGRQVKFAAGQRIFVPAGATATN